MRKIARRIIIAAALLALSVALALLSVYQASRRVPDFYRRALAAAPAAQHEGGQRFEQQALALHNQLHHAGRWEIRFTQDDINGWLAAELPEKFPQLLPAGVSEPRVAIDKGAVRVAVHYERGGVDTIVSLAGHVQLTEQPNEIAVRIDQARAGLVPVPLARFLEEIAQRAARADIPLRWTESQGAPVALVRVPLETKDARRQLVLERLDFREGEFTVAGRTKGESTDQDNQAPPVTANQSAESETRQR
jgi:hypothetical protein